jgi:hypothetical protein
MAPKVNPSVEKTIPWISIEIVFKIIYVDTIQSIFFILNIP